MEFARVRRDQIDLVVWERGFGITLACGTGACATVVAACLEGRVQPGVEPPVNLPGGTLHITARGPAKIVFTAEVDPAQIRRPAGR